MSAKNVLVIDDERDIRELLTITLGRMDLKVDAVGMVAEARHALTERRYDLCFTDMRLPDGNGQELVELITHKYPDTPVAMITAFGNVEAAVNALKAGAFDFVSKPVDIQILRRLVRSALKLGEGRQHDPANAKKSDDTHRLIGTSPAIQLVRATIKKLARHQAPVYIAGESGVGKELVARLIHEQGPRASGPFVPVNCGAIPSELMESEFFGHRKGSFTGAHADKSGLFQAANGGTLFLDEVAELPLHMQVKLLRVIQEKAVRPIGAREEVPVDVRILSATHKSLETLVEHGQFRQDLFYRINVIELFVPPLRDRRGDVPLLAEHILAQYSARHGIDLKLTSQALLALERYEFPGNVRQLENILERAFTLHEEEEIIDTSDLLLSHHSHHHHGTAGASTYKPITELSSIDTRSQPIPGKNAPAHDYIANLERGVLNKALEESDFDRTLTAQKLGISVRTLGYKLKKLGIEV